jgi:hypothetical protein
MSICPAITANPGRIFASQSVVPEQGGFLLAEYATEN